ncbi:hypothetical protein SAMN05216251_124111 [Actinacidiphila alni]|uniref:Uncharacterized protein n=1 Tax=Actinacidiphila alni TaxID=380248 RepID=A0A1I2KSJ0_9ACTN|nr:hypothetical protein [Actinacidiphila alni]SFF69249.1 hypothetical protein SAMN05216251_124111 [Actinacidiphila alni]
MTEQWPPGQNDDHGRRPGSQDDPAAPYGADAPGPTSPRHGGSPEGPYGAGAPAAGHDAPNAGGPGSGAFGGHGAYDSAPGGAYAADQQGAGAAGHPQGGGQVPGPYAYGASGAEPYPYDGASGFTGAESHGQGGGYADGTYDAYGGGQVPRPYASGTYGQVPGPYADGGAPGHPGTRDHGHDGYGGGPAYGSAGYEGGHDGGRTYVPEPLAGPMPPYAEPGAPYGAPQAGDSWAGHATAAGGDWQQGAGHPHPQAYGETERTAVLPVVESVPQQTPGRRAEPTAAAEAAAGTPVRTGSPIIAPGIQPAALTAALGLLMAGGAAIGKPGLAVVLVLLQAVTAAGWFRLNGMWPARQGIVLAFLSGVTADIGLLIASGDHGPEVLLGTLGVWLLLVLVLQLRHHGSGDERMASLTATSASTLLTVLAAGYLATATSDAGSDPVVVGAIAVAAAALVRALPLPGPASVVAALAAAAATGLATGSATGTASGDAVLTAAACGVCALVGLRVASYDFPSRFVHFTAGVALPLTAAAPAVYVLGRALTG